MKTLSQSRGTTVPAFIKFLAVAIVLSACGEKDVAPTRPAETPFPSLEKLGESSQKLLSHQSEGPHYNLNVILQSGNRRSFGFIKFRQLENETQLIHLDTWIAGLEPNTSYLLQRAVDTTLDGNCTGTAWLTLGKGLEPQNILTNAWGFGEGDLFRSVATIPVGTTFDIHFQIVKESTSEVVLTSDCYQYTVR